MKQILRLLTLVLVFLTISLTNVQLVYGEDVEDPALKQEEQIAIALVALFSKSPVEDPDTALQHAQAAIAAANAVENKAITPYLLLGIARKESHYSSNSVSRVVCSKNKITGEKTCKRKTGNWNSEKKGNFQGSYFCGVMQVAAKFSWKTCRSYANSIELTYMKGATELNYWWNTKACSAYWKDSNKRLQCSLAGHAGGWNSIKRAMSNKKSRAYRYAQTCLGYANRIKRAALDTVELDI